jgi:hypothetical protein
MLSLSPLSILMLMENDPIAFYGIALNACKGQHCNVLLLYMWFINGFIEKDNVNLLCNMYIWMVAVSFE